MSLRKFFALSILSLLSVAACHKATQDPPSGSGRRGPGNAPVPVAVASVTRQDVPIFLPALGSVQAYNTVTLRTRIDGQIMAVYFREGQEVHKGQVLALIDPRPYEVALETARANLARDQAQQKTAQANLARYKALWEAGVVALQDYQTQEATAGQFNGTVQADQAAINNAKLNLQYTRIISPVDGRIGLRLIDAGNIVHANDANGMLVVTQMHPIAVVFTLPQEQLPSVLAQSRKGALSVQAYSSDDQTLLGTGKLETVDNQIDPATGTAKLKSVFSNQEGTLWPNQFVNVHLQLSVTKNALTIPAAAVQRGPDGDLAYVMGTDRKITIQPVTIQMTQGNVSLVASGLQEGQQVVTEGQDKLQAGTTVAPRTPSAGAGTVGATSGGGMGTAGSMGSTSASESGSGGGTSTRGAGTPAAAGAPAPTGAGSGTPTGVSGAMGVVPGGSRTGLAGSQRTPQGAVAPASPAAASSANNVGGSR
jgi:membrane fusion protein, multidrug efflux system